MRVLVSGSSGFIGRAVVRFLNDAGHEVVRLVRSPAPTAGRVSWDPVADRIDTAGMAGVEGVVHLAGEPLADTRWTPEKKVRIRESRVRGTRLLAEALAKLAPPPAVLVSASAIGYYGNRGDEVLTEASAGGRDFLAAVCRDWEAAAQPAAIAGIRVVNPRIGQVLGKAGGMLARMLPIYRLGAGGPLGSGRQWMSWIALDDLLGAVRLMLTNDGISGPVNLVSPHPTRNAEFARSLGRVLGRPAVLPAPAFALRLAFGELADDALLASQRVLPARLEAAGFAFRYPQLEAALRHALRN
jgi:uncharacterized protein (TIGR01777 family)